MIHIGFVANPERLGCQSCGFPARRMFEISAAPNGRTPTAALRFCRMCAQDVRGALAALPEDLQPPRLRALLGTNPIHANDR